MKSNRNQVARQEQSSIAGNRCIYLIGLAKEVFSTKPNLAQRYVTLARKIAMRHRISLGAKDFCKNCNTVFIAGTTLQVRINSNQKTISYRCKVCKQARRFGYRLKKSSKFAV